MEEQTVKRVVAVDVIHRPGKKKAVHPRTGVEYAPVEVIAPGTILRGLPRTEVEDLMARGAARLQQVVVEVVEAPKGKGGSGGKSEGGDQKPAGDGKGGESDKGGEKK